MTENELQVEPEVVKAEVVEESENEQPKKVSPGVVALMSVATAMGGDQLPEMVEKASEKPPKIKYPHSDFVKVYKPSPDNAGQEVQLGKKTYTVGPGGNLIRADKKRK